MSNSKISALTSATTPLAGTEVTPVVQSGATKKVTVADLTAGRDITAKSLVVGIAVSPLGDLDAVANTAAKIYLRTGTAAAGSGTIYFNVANNFSGISQSYIKGLGSGVSGVSQLRFGVSTTAGAVTGTDVFEIDNNANLIPLTAGKGINFTANTPAAGMTSQLLNWYEEGTYTATLTPATSGTIPLNSNFDTLAYTRIGRQVTITGQIQIFNPSSPVGSYFKLNLPFTPADLPEISGRGGFMLNYQNTAVSTYWEESTAVLYIIKDASTVANSDNLYISFSYFAA